MCPPAHTEFMVHGIDESVTLELERRATSPLRREVNFRGHGHGYKPHTHSNQRIQQGRCQIVLYCGRL